MIAWAFVFIVLLVASIYTSNNEVRRTAQLFFGLFVVGTVLLAIIGVPVPVRLT